MEYLSLLPVGFRFKPTDQELISYLKLKINGGEIVVIGELDISKYEPHDLPDMSMVKSADEWFFFCPSDGLYPSGRKKINRATVAGYWKPTGKDTFIASTRRGLQMIGKKKILVFYTGRAPKGIKTPWVIHEYHAIEPAFSGEHPGQRAFVICRLIKKDDGTEAQAGVHGMDNVPSQIPGDTGLIRDDDFAGVKEFVPGSETTESMNPGVNCDTQMCNTGSFWDFDYADIEEFLRGSADTERWNVVGTSTEAAATGTGTSGTHSSSEFL